MRTIKMGNILYQGIYDDDDFQLKYRSLRNFIVYANNLTVLALIIVMSVIKRKKEILGLISV